RLNNGFIIYGAVFNSISISLLEAILFGFLFKCPIDLNIFLLYGTMSYTINSLILLTYLLLINSSRFECQSSYFPDDRQSYRSRKVSLSTIFQSPLVRRVSLIKSL